MKKAFALILCAILCASALVSCGGGSSVETEKQTETAPQAQNETPTDDANTNTSEETEPEAPAFDASKLTDFAWGVSNSTVVGALTFDGDNATLNILKDGEDKSISGPVTVEDGKMTIDGTEIAWSVVASFCKLTIGEDQYSLSKSESADAAKGPYTLLTNSWSGDGASLSFDGTKATIAIDGTDYNYTGTYTLESASNLVIADETNGNSTENLAEGATATSSSNETDSLLPDLVVDGDYTTRWASAYEDPSWLVLDLGSAKKVGGCIFTFEAAYPTDFEIQGSNDNENWDTLLSVTGNASGGSASGAEVIPVSFKFDKTGEYQYYRYYGTARATTYGHSFWEWELYETIAGKANCELAYNGDTVTLTVGENSYKLSK